MKTALGEHWKPAFDPLAKSFVSSLQSSVIKTSVSKVIPKGVTGVKSALGWVAKNVRSAGRGEWSPSIGTAADYWRRQTPVISQKEPSALSAGEPKVGVPGASIPETSSGLPGLRRNLFETPFNTQPTYTVDYLIEHLSCNREDVRLTAAQMLRQKGPSLTSSEVGRVVKLLNDNSVRYRISPSGSFYDTAPVRYYAAKALNGMNSRYLPISSRQNAGEIVSPFNTPHYDRPASAGILKAAEL